MEPSVWQTLSNHKQNHTGNQQMTFTNTKSVENNWYWYEVCLQVEDQVFNQVNVQVPHQVFEQFKSIRNKITQEINK